LTPTPILWQPLLDGTSAAGAREAVSAILDALATSLIPPSLVELADNGPAVLYCYLAECSAGDSHLSAFRACLHAATLDTTPEGPIPACLYGGLAGLGWTVLRLQQAFGIDGETVAGEVDEALAEYLGQSPWTDPYDLISGLVGLGVYALERLPRPLARTCLERIVHHLTETAQRRPNGGTWWTRPEWIAPTFRADCPDGYYNLGLAHGVPGVIGLLGGIVAAEIDLPRSRPLLESAVQWLLAQDRADGKGFPAWLEARTGLADRPSRLAWCYGDAGVAAALLCAARAVGETCWEEAALRIARRGARRPAQDCGVVDTGLCHGAAGLGHLFNRMYQTTGDAELAVAAKFWFGQVFALRQPDKAIAGFPAWDVDPIHRETWVASARFLEGAAGVGLALLAAISPVEPTWDRLLLISLPPVGATSNHFPD
jgi:hypothetical protein